MKQQCQKDETESQRYNKRSFVWQSEVNQKRQGKVVRLRSRGIENHGNERKMKRKREKEQCDEGGIRKI